MTQIQHAYTSQIQHLCPTATALSGDTVLDHLFVWMAISNKMCQCMQAHSLADMLLDSDTQLPAARDKVEQVVQAANASRGIDYSVDRNQQQAISLLARQLHRLQVLLLHCIMQNSP